MDRQGGYGPGNFGSPRYLGGVNNMGGFGGIPNDGFGQQGPSMGKPPQQPEKKKEINCFASFDPLKQ
mgnify:CR=1 FL=1